MALTLIPNLTTVAQGESADAGAWSGNSGGFDTEVFMQNTASYTWQAAKSSRTPCTYTPTTNINISGTDNHLYWWAQNAVASFMENKTTGTTTASGYTIRLADSVGNDREYHVAGKDTWGGEWKCFVIDLNYTTGTEIYASSGTLDLTDIDVITWYVDISNSGNIRIIDNQWNDVVRFGTGVTATGTDFDLNDIWAEDYLLANKYGILERVGNTLFAKGKIIIGNGVTTTTFNSVDEKLEFIQREGAGEGLVGSTLYEFKAQGSGCVVDAAGLIISGGSINAAGRFLFDISDVTSDVTLDGCIVTYAALVNSVSVNDLQNNIFNNCLQIDPSTGIFKYNTVKNYVGTEGGAILWPSDDTNITDLTLSNNNDAIEYTATSDSTPTFRNMVFDDVTAKYDVNNTSGSAVTIPLTGTSNANSYNPGGSTVTFDASVTITYTVSDADTGALIQYARINIVNASTKAELYQIETNVSGVATQTHTYTGDLDIEGWVRQMDIVGDDYTPKDFSGTIKSTGFDTNIKLTKL